ncbi:MAG: hypothetical protein ACYC96_11435 [Fimbriimonadaceae bacterium]
MKNRNSLILALTLGALALSSFAAAGRDQGSTTPSIVTVSANGADVRNVLHDLFGQTKQNYVIEDGVHYTLYLSLDKVAFDEALAIVCHLAKIKAEKLNGIYYVLQDTPPAAPSKSPNSKPEASPRHVLTSRIVTPSVTQATLRAKRISTRLAKTDIRKVFATIAKEAGIPIVVDASVPRCKLDAFLEKTSLKYALDQIAGAAKLRYRIIQKESILVYSDETENRVAVSETGNGG